MNPLEPQESQPGQQALRRVLLENTDVLVVETVYPIGGSAPLHEHCFPHVLYVIEGGTIEATAPDGSVKIVELISGQTLWRGPLSHSTRNVGANAVRFIEVELKNATL